ncbi:MAG TPA: hypothetical protein VH482_21920 [Thermomicrobiales bacterium]|jgi:hypothetical protein
MFGRTMRTALLAAAVFVGVAAAHGADAQSLGPKVGAKPALTCCPDRIHRSSSQTVHVGGYTLPPIGLRPMGMRFP